MGRGASKKGSSGYPGQQRRFPGHPLQVRGALNLVCLRTGDLGFVL